MKLTIPRLVASVAAEPRTRRLNHLYRSPYTESLERLQRRQERNDQFKLPPSFKDIESKEGNAIGLPMSQIFPQILCLQVGVCNQMLYI